MLQLKCYIITLLIETPLILLMLKKRIATTALPLITAMIPSLITHPILWHATQKLPNNIPYSMGILALEILVTLIETWIIFKLFRPTLFKALKTSTVANTTSTLLGIWLWKFL